MYLTVVFGEIVLFSVAYYVKRKCVMLGKEGVQEDAYVFTSSITFEGFS